MNVTFLSWPYLLGVSAALIPLVLHLSRSRRTKKIRFSTTRFFTDQFLRSYRMSRLQELFLLGCRMALFALLAVALARPFLGPREAAGGLADGGPRTVMLVLDDSASMGCREQGRTLFARAQEAAEIVLGTLGPGDVAGVVLAGRRATGPEILAAPTDDLDHVRAAVAQAQVQSLGTDLSGAIRKARELVAGKGAAGRAVTVCVLSDLQRSGWDTPEGFGDPGQTDLSFVFVSLRPQTPPANRAVTAVRYAATQPAPGTPFDLRPLLALGGENDGDIAVRLHVDGLRVAEQRTERLPGGRWAAPRFSQVFAEPGWHGGHVEVDDTVLDADNRRYFAVEVPAEGRTVPVLAVNGAPSQVPARDELYFLRLALTAAPEGQKPPFELRAVAPGELGGIDLTPYPLVILANVERLTEAAVEKLEEYVDTGGKLLVFLGDRIDPAFYNATLAGANRRHGGLLPGTIVGRKPQKAGHIRAVRYEHHALARFQEPKLGSLLGPGLTFQALEVEAPAAQVLMRSSAGLALLSEKAFGKGKVLLFASTCDRDWSDFPVRQAFLLWSRFVAGYLTQSPLNLQVGHQTGDVVRLTGRPGEKGVPWVRKPDGRRVAAARASDGSGDFTFAETLVPGVYTVLGNDQESRVGLFAVNLDAYESDLSYLDDGLTESRAVVAELSRRLGGAPLVRHVTDPATLAVSGGGQGSKLWDRLLAVVLLLALFEPWLANLISARLYARRVTAPVVPAPQPAGVLEVPARPVEVVR